jgi:enoyl-CoA hydratase
MGNVRVEVKDKIAILTLDNPPLNVLSIDMGRQIDTAVRQVEHDDNVVAVVLTGAGDRAFMAGADIKEFPRYIDDHIAEEMALVFDETMTRLQNIGKPTIAALNGMTLGGGCELALTCDFRIAEEQVFIGLPEIKLGVFPGAGGTQRLPRLIGASRAKELILVGEPISAKEAYRIGLVNRLVPIGQALEAACTFAGVFRERSLAAIRSAKTAIDGGLELDLQDGLKREARLFGEAFETHDGQEGIRAFIEKRAPNFTHR